jgi:hypothetical protein
MIELNCTYEESKKILELGYDFSKICTKFVELRNNNDEVKINFGEKISNRSIRSEYTLIDDESWFQSIAWIENFVPIIPKAALEACLPEFETNKAWFSMVKDNYSEARTHYWVFETPKTIPQSDTWNRRPRMLMRYVKNQMLYENLHSAYFESAFEAFIWCHENYSKELKKKFDEVSR